MIEILGWDAWAEKYQPIKNTIKPSNELMFETYGEELEFIQNCDERFVWTNVQGDMSDLIVAGYAYVNRLSYYVTEIPWDDENQYVLISVEKECECYNYDTDEGSEDCKVCQGYGLVTEYVG